MKNMRKLEEGMKWPPTDLFRHKTAEYSAWYSGEAALLADFYHDNDAKNLLNLTYSSPCRNNGFWARQISNNSNFYIHVPVAGDIAETSSAFLFGKSPIIRFKSDSEDMKDEQDALDKMLTDSGFFSKIVEGAEICSAIGGVYMKVVWDSEMSEEPIPMLVQCDMAFPIFKYGKLSEVTFVYEVLSTSEDNTKYRLAETITKGKIINVLYEGSANSLGEIVPLNTIDETADLDEEIDTAGVMTAVYIPNLLPNKLNRQSPQGRSDLCGLETLMDSLDEVFSDWMVDVQIARGKIHVPAGYLTKLKDEAGTHKFNIDTMAYMEMECDPTSLSTQITATQFEIRAEDYERTCLNLLDRIITSAGYSPQSFGLNIQGRAESGTALNVRERKSFSTTNKKQSYWEPALKQIVKAMCAIKNAFLNGNFKNEGSVNIAFSDSISNNFSELSTAVKTLSDAKALSTKTKLMMIHPEWTDVQIDEEIELINNDTKVGEPLDNPEDTSQLGFNQSGGNLNEGENNSSDDKSECLVNKVI